MASIGLLTVVAIDRYITICRPDIGILSSCCCMRCDFYGEKFKCHIPDNKLKLVWVLSEYQHYYTIRFHYKCEPPFLSLGQKMTVQSYNLLILAAWLNAVFWSSMPVVGWAAYAPDPTGATCTINWRQNNAWGLHFYSIRIKIIVKT